MSPTPDSWVRYAARALERPIRYRTGPDPDDWEWDIEALSLNSIEQAFRPRDDWDVDVHPESLRGKVLASYDAFDALPRWLRVLSRIMAWRPWR